VNAVIARLCRKKMILKTLFVAPILIFLTSCSDQRIQSNWARRSPTIDGNLEEWSSASLVIFEDLQVSLGVGNDASFLYLAGRIANAPLALRQAKAALNASYDEWLKQGLKQELDMYAPLIATRDRREALEAFAQKRKPVWKGA